MTAITLKRPPTFFSLGALLRLWWQPRHPFAAFSCAALGLATLSAWDWLLGAGRVDFILLGLAGYELILGLTE